MTATPAVIRLATPADAPELHRVIHTAFAARRAVDPPADALSDTVADIRQALADGYGVCAERDGAVVACLLVEVDGAVATLRRVSVLPEESHHGLARQIVEGALGLAVELGFDRVELLTRREFPELLAWWEAQGFAVAREVPPGFILSRQLPVLVEVPTAERMQELGRRLATLLRAGDVIIATGDLGAGKTTLAQGLGEGLGVAGPIISPTFVISRVHRSLADGPDFVHVDAYRMGDSAELADIDLDATLPRSVTLIEWGEGKAEWLADNRLEINIERASDATDDGRTVLLDGVGPRWDGVLSRLREAS